MPSFGGVQSMRGPSRGQRSHVPEVWSQSARGCDGEVRHHAVFRDNRRVACGPGGRRWPGGGRSQKRRHAHARSACWGPDRGSPWRRRVENRHHQHWRRANNAVSGLFQCLGKPQVQAGISRLSTGCGSEATKEAGGVVALRASIQEKPTAGRWSRWARSGITFVTGVRGRGRVGYAGRGRVALRALLEVGDGGRGRR